MSKKRRISIPKLSTDNDLAEGKEETSDLVDAFRTVTICFTGLSAAEEKKVTQALTSLGASSSKPLDANIVTHLIVKKVGSPKHAFAINEGIACVTIKWILDCYLEKKYLPLESYCVLPFTGLCIVATQILPSERNKIENLVTSNGGIFSCGLTKNATHLIAEKDEGEKYMHAIAWGICICSAQWIYDCVKEKKWLSESDYSITNSKSNSKFPLLSNAELNIEHFKEKSTNQKRNAPIPKPEAIAMPAFSDVSSWPPTASMPDSDVFKYDTFFIGGFSTEMKNYCVRVIIAGGGKRHHCLSEKVTKILIGDVAESKFIDEVRRHPTGAVAVSLRWVVNMAMGVSESAAPKSDKDDIVPHLLTSAREGPSSLSLQTDNVMSKYKSQWADRSARARSMMAKPQNLPDKSINTSSKQLNNNSIVNSLTPSSSNEKSSKINNLNVDDESQVVWYASESYFPE